MRIPRGGQSDTCWRYARFVEISPSSKRGGPPGRAGHRVRLLASPPSEVRNPDVVRPPGCGVLDGGDPCDAAGATVGAVGASTGRTDGGALWAVFNLVQS